MAGLSQRIVFGCLLLLLGFPPGAFALGTSPAPNATPKPGKTPASTAGPASNATPDSNASPPSNATAAPRVTPPEIFFGRHALGIRTIPVAVRIENPAAYALSLQLGTVPPDYLVDMGDCGEPVPPQGSCTLTVRFTPLLPGPSKGELLLEYPQGPDGKSHANLSVTLTGDGATPELGVSPSSLSFPAAPAGSSMQQTITLTNFTNRNLQVRSVTFRGAFEVKAPSLLQPLKPREALVLRVRPQPCLGECSGQVTILSDAIENPQAVRLQRVPGWGCLAGLSGVRGSDLLLSLFLCLAYWLAVVTVRWHRVALVTRGDLAGELDAVKAELDSITLQKDVRQPVDDLLAQARKLLEEPQGRSWSRRLDILFWSRGQEINGWGYAHEAQIRMVKLLPEATLKARLEIIEPTLRLAGETCATAVADAIRTLLAADKPDLDRMKALLSEGLAMSYSREHEKFASLMGWQNKASWLVLCGLSAIVSLTAVFPQQAVLLVVGAAGGLISRLSRSLDQKDIPTDYGASWTTLFLSPVAGAVGAWAGIMIAALAVKANILGPLFQVDWEKPEGVGTLAVALLFGFSERLLDSVLDKLDGVAESGKGAVPSTATLTIDDSKLPEGQVGHDYPGVQLDASGATGTVQWSLAPGSTRPPGLTVSLDGKIAGTPAQQGTFPFTVEAADTKGKASKTLTVKVNP